MIFFLWKHCDNLRISIEYPYMELYDNYAINAIDCDSLRISIGYPYMELYHNYVIDALDNGMA